MLGEPRLAEQLARGELRWMRADAPRPLADSPNKALRRRRPPGTRHGGAALRTRTMAGASRRCW